MHHFEIKKLSNSIIIIRCFILFYICCEMFKAKAISEFLNHNANLQGVFAKNKFK